MDNIPSLYYPLSSVETKVFWLKRTIEQSKGRLNYQPLLVSYPLFDQETKDPMCRLVAYSGVPCALESVITLPPHSLIEQSHAATEAKLSVNGDGFGFAWYDQNRLSTTMEWFLGQSLQVDNQFAGKHPV